MMGTPLYFLAFPWVLGREGAQPNPIFLWGPPLKVGRGYPIYRSRLGEGSLGKKEIVLCGEDAEAATPRPKLKPVCFKDIEPEEVNWLWRPYIPKGMVSIIEGDPGLGKSWMTLALASALSQGKPLPNAKVALPPQKVLIMNSEDSPQHTIRPRLDALGANVELIFQAPRHFPLDKDGILEMEEYLHDVAAGVVFIDPIVGWIGSKVDMHRANEVREVMGALDRIARNSGASIIVVRHLRKGGAGGKAIYAGIGSIDFTAAARSVLLVERTKSNDTVVRHIKCNVAPLGPTLQYAYNEYVAEDKDGNPCVSSRFEWLGVYSGVVGEDEDFPQPGETSSSPRLRDHAWGWLQDLLKEGPVLAQDVYYRGEAAGFSRNTLRRAKTEHPELSHFMKSGFIYWRIDGAEAETPAPKAAVSGGKEPAEPQAPAGAQQEEAASA